MPERRDCRITANIETTYKLMMERVCKADGLTESQYIRQLLVHDFNKRGLLTHELLLRLATTDSIEQIEQLAAKQQQQQLAPA